MRIHGLCAAVILVVTVLAFAGGTAPATADAAENPFAGGWSGSFVIVGTPLGGTQDWTVTDTGRITGSALGTGGQSIVFVGHISSQGTIQAVALVEGQGAQPGQGSAYIDAEGRLVGTVTMSWSGGFTLNFVLERVD